MNWRTRCATTACTRGSRGRRDRAPPGRRRAASELFEQVMLDELRRWMALADERMAPSASSVYVMAGNDDPWSCDAVIEAARTRQSCDDRVVEVGDHEMISCSYANPTPWNSPRELDEDDLYARIKRSPTSSRIRDGDLQPPRPAVRLGPRHGARDRRPAAHRRSRRPADEIPVGSPAVRQILEEYQPLVALHGHIHESRGAARSADARDQLGVRVQQRAHPRGPAREAGGRRRTDTSSRRIEKRGIWLISRSVPEAATVTTRGSSSATRRASCAACRQRAAGAQLHPGAPDPDARRRCCSLSSPSFPGANPYLAL